MQNTQEVQELSKEVQNYSRFVRGIVEETGKILVGQKTLVDRLIVALLCEGHVLLEGLPGLAKTLTIKTLADTLDATFSRVQFTPDLLPSDLMGSMIFNPKTAEFFPKKGPIFANLILADEVNRAPAKVQSALLEAMGEKQVTLGETTYRLEEPFIVLATQNPIEQEGTYTLPEAQLDRFLFKVKVGYPTVEEEKVILNRMSGVEILKAEKVTNKAEVLAAKKLASRIYLDERLKDYILKLVFSTRFPKDHRLSEIEKWIQVGASPRATISLAKAARGQAFLHQRGYVLPEDIRQVAADVLRHRILLTFEAEAEGINIEDLIQKILDTVPVP